MSKSMIRHISPDSIPLPIGYSHVVEVNGGKLVLISGQVVRNSHGALVGKDDFRVQLEQVLPI